MESKSLRRLFKLLFVLGTLLVVTEQTDAQSARYRLRMPTADEYLTALPALVNAETAEDKSQYEQDSSAFQVVTTAEACQSFPDLPLVKLDTLYNATSAILLDQFTDGGCSQHWWQHLILNAWLREDKIDLQTKAQWHFRDYTLTLTPVHLSGSKQPELIAELRKGTGYPLAYQEFLVLQRDEALPGDYAQIKMPRLWFDDCGVHWGCGGGAQTFKIEDVNGDGLPEWIVAYHECGYGDCGGGLLVLGWRQGQMVDLAKADWPNSLSWDGSAYTGPSPALPPDGTWTFQRSSSGQHQIIQRDQFHDNRDCQMTYMTIFTWNNHQDRFMPGDRTTTYDDSAACALRRGQADLQASDYFEAITAYQRAVALLPTSGESYAAEALQYAQVRLMLAYALAGQADQALALRDKIQVETPQSAAMSDLFDAIKLYHADKDQVALCAAIHQTIQEKVNNQAYSTDAGLGLFGQTDDVPYRGDSYAGGDFSSDTTGCNVDSVLDKVIGALPIVPGTAPDSILAASGIQIVQSFKADLNGDGNALWLFWMDNLPEQALLFVPAGNTYHFSLLNLPALSANQQLNVIQLPDGAGNALVSVSFGNYEYDDPCGPNLPDGYLQMWRSENGNLRASDVYLLCQPMTLRQLFPSPFELHAWQVVTDGQRAVEKTFPWNTSRAAYESPSMPTEAPQTAQSCLFELYCRLDLADPHLLPILNSLLANLPKGASPAFLSAAEYARALVSLRTGNSGAALSDFVAVYENTPSAAWRKLAALHIQAIQS